MLEVKIISDTKAFWEDPSWLSAVTGIAAILLSAASFFFQNKSLKRQLYISFKEKWIYDLKHNVALFLSNSLLQRNFLYTAATQQSLATQNPENMWVKEILKETLKNFFEHRRVGIEASQNIRIFLNEKDSIHRELSDLIEEWKIQNEKWYELNKEKPAPSETRKLIDNEINELRKKTILATQAVLNAEIEHLTR